MKTYSFTKAINISFSIAINTDFFFQWKVSCVVGLLKAMHAWTSKYKRI